MLIMLPIYVLWMVVAFRQSQRFLHYFQIEEYDNLRFISWLFTNLLLLVRRLLITSVVLLVANWVIVLVNTGSELAAIMIAVFWGGGAIFVLVTTWRQKNPIKKPLVYTARAKRLLIV